MCGRRSSTASCAAERRLTLAGVNEFPGIHTPFPCSFFAVLGLIFSCSKHFSESAMTEYNAPQAQWAFTIAAGQPNAGQRDLNAIEAHFHALWSHARHP